MRIRAHTTVWHKAFKELSIVFRSCL